MSRIRTIKPEFFTHECLAAMSPCHRLLFAGLLTQADRAGRLQDRPMRIKHHVLPYDAVDVDAMLSDLAAHEERFIIRYEVGGKRLIQITNFETHQRPNNREPQSELPPPPDAEVGGPLQHAQACSSMLKHAQEEGKGMEGNGREGNGKEHVPGSPGRGADPMPVVLATLLRQRIVENKPDARVPDDLGKWADEIRLMLVRDGRTPERVRQVIDWCQADAFWRSNVLSGGKLREKFDALELQMQRRPVAQVGGARHAADRTTEAIEQAFGSGVLQ